MLIPINWKTHRSYQAIAIDPTNLTNPTKSIENIVTRLLEHTDVGLLTDKDLGSNSGHCTNTN